MGTCFCQTGPYKEHFVCFHCRKMFKKPSFAEIHPSQRPATYAKYRPPCPDCGQPMHNMGKEFAPARRSDLKAWRELERRHREIQHESMTSPQSRVGHIRHG
jgi:hypothetical protein